MQIALAGRAMPVPLARQRARGPWRSGREPRLHRGRGTGTAASHLLRPPDEEVAGLARRTEGWAAGLYLATLSRTGIRPATGVRDVRLATDFLQSQLLAQEPG